MKILKRLIFIYRRNWKAVRTPEEVQRIVELTLKLYRGGHISLKQAAEGIEELGIPAESVLVRSIHHIA